MFTDGEEFEFTCFIDLRSVVCGNMFLKFQICFVALQGSRAFRLQ